MSLPRSPSARGRSSRRKGGDAEREVVELARAVGFDAKRNWRSGASGGGDVLGIPNVHLECKRCEAVKVWQWIAQAEADARVTDVAVVAFRRSRSRWYGVVSLVELLSLLREVQELRAA